jgi:hypothetical protein
MPPKKERQIKNIIVLITLFSFLIFNLPFNPQIYAQVEEIEAEEVAKQLAENAEGKYVKGPSVPSVEESEIALPIIDESTGDILGYIVADKTKLISALNAAGLTDVAEALAAVEAGKEAGAAVGAGLSGGTIALIALGVAALVGLGLALSGSGGGGDGGSDGGVTPTTPTTGH